MSDACSMAAPPIARATSGDGVNRQAQARAPIVAPSGEAGARRESAAPDTWYSPTHLPPRRAEVRLVCQGGFVLNGWHDVRALSGYAAPWWFERRGNVLVPLERIMPEPRGRLSPVAWQPLDAARWAHPLPAAAIPFVGFGPRWQPPQPPRQSVAEAPPPQTDPIGEFETRMLRAFQVDAALPDADRAKLKVRSQWPETRPGPGDYPPEQITRYRPTREHVSDYLVVMRHIARLTKPEQRVVRLRALGWGFASIARTSEEIDEHRARRTYADARLRCWRYACDAGDARSGLEHLAAAGRPRHAARARRARSDGDRAGGGR